MRRIVKGLNARMQSAHALAIVDMREWTKKVGGSEARDGKEEELKGKRAENRVRGERIEETKAREIEKVRAEEYENTERIRGERSKRERER